MGDRYTLSLPTQSCAIRLSGANQENLKTMTELTGVQFVLRGQDLLMDGTEAQIQLCKQLIDSLKQFWAQDRAIASVDIASAMQAIEQNREEEWRDRPRIARTRKGEVLQPRTHKQQQYIQTIESHALTFGVGPAGTGKTFLAAVTAVRALQENRFDRLILTRPAVEAGEKLGFLPGDLQQKVNPYLRPLYDAIYELIEPEKIPQLMERGTIEVAPLAYMRGRTLNNAFIIVDEAQNTTPSQMKMVLTRLGFNSCMVVTGDITQIDLPRQQESGLIAILKILEDVEGIGFTYFTRSDVVRHPLVQRIIAAYELAGE